MSEKLEKAQMDFYRDLNKNLTEGFDKILKELMKMNEKPEKKLEDKKPKK